ncbi:MAG: regulatory domain of in-like proprotein convertase, partial [Pedosphaera sp.]|nr:regulatory domain of in-like proprotein convertase [Pedosphaera sp.]
GPVADGFDLEGNVFFFNGALANSHQGNVLIGPFQGVAQNLVIVGNYIYDTMGSGADFYLGNSTGAVVMGNYFQTSASFNSNTDLTLTGNTFVSGTINLDQSQFPSNNYLAVAPTTNVVIVEPNKYEPGRANIIIYNWENLSSVAVNVSHVLLMNTPFEVRNAENFYGPPVLTGIYSGAPLDLRMVKLSIAQPVAVNAPSSAGPAFKAFILLPISTSTVIGAGLPGLINGAAAWGDFDNDGNLDILLTGEDADYNFLTQVWRNLGNGSFTNISAGLPGVVDSAIAWGDFDNDGRLDILLTGYGIDGQFISQVWRNLGNGAFSNINVALPGVADGAVAWGDFDNDGFPDILLTGYNGSNPIAQVWRNLGNGQFTNINVALPGVYHSAVAWGDYNHDGKLDILLSGNSDAGPITQVWRNLGNGQFANINAGLPGTLAGSVAWGDFNNDQNLDLVLTGLSDNGVTPISQVWQNLGNSTFSNINAGLPGVYYSSVAWGDYDNDGNPDLLLTGYDGAKAISQIWRNLGDGTFTNINATLPGLDKSSVAWGDYNNDGKLDALLIGQGGTAPNSAVWQNSFPPANSAPNAPGNLRSLVSSNGVVLSWGAAADCQTPANGLSYNLRVGTTPGGADILSPQANPASGWRQLPQLGNAQNCLQATLTNLAIGTYYWSVQAIDTAFAGSTFAPEATFSVGWPGIVGAFNTNGHFQLQFNGGSAPTFTLQTSTDLLQWVNLANLLLSSNGQSQFTDTNSAQSLRRFYRLSHP